MSDNMAKPRHCTRETKKMWQSCRISRRDCSKCPEPELLAGYLDHRLSESRAEEVERHLLQCPSCFESSLVIQQAMDTYQHEALDEAQLQQLYALVPEKPGLLRRAINQMAERLASMVVPAPAFALSILLVCGLGFYAGMETWAKQDLFQTQVAAELDFFFDNPAMWYESTGEEG